MSEKEYACLYFMELFYGTIITFADSENNIKLLGEEVATLTDLLVQQNISPKETDPVIHKEDPDVPFFDRFRS